MCILQLINRIFHYLEPKDRKNAALVCKQWLQMLSREEFAIDCPLTFDHVLIKKRHLPITVFRKTKQFRFFTCVHIGKVTYTDDTEYFTMFHKIGKNTTHLRITDNCHPFLLSCFPSVTVLHLRKLKDILNFTELPSTIEVLIIDELYVLLDLEVHQKLLVFKNLREIKCGVMYFHVPKELNSLAGGAKAHVQVFGVTEELFDAIDQCQSFLSKVKVDHNLMDEQIVDCDDITAVYLRTGRVKFDTLHKFKNLKVIIAILINNDNERCMYNIQCVCN